MWLLQAGVGLKMFHMPSRQDDDSLLPLLPVVAIFYFITGHSTQRKGVGQSPQPNMIVYCLFNSSSSSNYRLEDRWHKYIWPLTGHQMCLGQWFSSLTFSFDSGLNSDSILIWIKVRRRYHSRVGGLSLGWNNVIMP